MLLAILFNSLFNAIISGIFGRALGVKLIRYFSPCLLFTNLFFIIYNAQILISTSGNFGNWITSAFFLVNWNLNIDSLTIIMLFVVNIISILVHFYSVEYMATDPHFCRFMAYISVFTFFMLVLIMSDNLLLLFLGWEGVGICSYLLISYWFTRVQANKAALKAIIVNRISDFSLLFSIILLFKLLNTIEFNILFALVPFLANYANTQTFFFQSINILTLITILIYIGAVGKSAQIMLHTWLPDAMEGPTPVSALIHAATMVTAGVFLIIKTAPILENTPESLIIIALSGTITSIFAATSGLLLTDIKKIIAYSTCSQLGYMILVNGLSAYSVSLFHLMNHAIFKALLFLCAGAIIHSLNDEQDLRKMGGLSKILPITYSAMLVATLAIIGFPFFTGFFSKDIILETAFNNFGLLGLFIHSIASFTALFTAIYSYKLLYSIFFINNNFTRKSVLLLHESFWQMATPLFLLSFGSIFIGFIFKDLLIGQGNIFININAESNISTLYLNEGEYVSTIVKLIPLLMCFIGLFIYFLSFQTMYKYCFFYNIQIFKIFKFFLNKWQIDRIYNKTINIFLLIVAKNWFYLLIDKGLLELIGPFGYNNFLYVVGKKLNILQNGNLTFYLFSMIIVILSYVYFMVI